MPRSSSRQNSVAKTATADPPQSQWVMITEEKLFDKNYEQDNSLTMCKLRHPKSDKPAMFMLCGGETTVSEMVKFTPDYGSWLIGNTVQKDGGLIVTTPVDPIFLVLPYLINAGKSGKFMTLDQIVHDADFPDCCRLLTCKGLNSLDQVADVKGADDLRAYRYSSDKTLAWLSMKVDSVTEALRNNNVSVGESGAHCASFVRSKKDPTEGDEAYMKYSYGLVSDYLPLDVSASLKQHLGIKETKENVKPEIKAEEPPAKKAKLLKEDIKPTEDYSSSSSQLKKENSKGKLTVAQKLLSKVDKSGMRSISSFFGAKS